MRVAALAALHFGVPPERLDVTRLTGDASTRSYFRVRSDRASVVVALYAEPFDESECAADRLARSESASPSARLTYANDPCAHIEVTRLLLEAGLPVPRILAAFGSERALLIEDVGDMKLQDWVAGREGRDLVEAYRCAVRMIAVIQEETEKALTSGSICSRLAFDEMKLKWELGFFFANYFNQYLGMKLDPATSQAVHREFKELCSDLAARPRVLVHRDYHARNLMMHDGRMFIIDHQDARMGPASYDLASLLGDPYSALDRGIARQMVAYFIELKSQSKVPLADVKEFLEEFELMSIQRMLKAIGTYAYQAAVANNQVYVKYIGPAISAAMASIEKVGRFDRIGELLESSGR